MSMQNTSNLIINCLLVCHLLRYAYAQHKWQQQQQQVQQQQQQQI
jgi:hypothetical protein